MSVLVDRRRKNAYDRSYDTRARWLPLAGSVIAKVRITSSWGTTTETGIGGGNDFSVVGNRSFAVERAIDDAIVKHIERVTPVDRFTLESGDKAYVVDLQYDRERYGVGKGGFRRSEMGVKRVVVLSLRTRYYTDNLFVKSFSRRGRRYTGIRDKRTGRFLRGGLVRHDDDTSIGRLDSYGYESEDVVGSDWLDEE